MCCALFLYMKYGQREGIFIKIRIKRYYIVISKALEELLYGFNVSTENRIIYGSSIHSIYYRLLFEINFSRSAFYF